MSWWLKNTKKKTTSVSLQLMVSPESRVMVSPDPQTSPLEDDRCQTFSFSGIHEEMSSDDVKFGAVDVECSSQIVHKLS